MYSFCCMGGMRHWVLTMVAIRYHHKSQHREKKTLIRSGWEKNCMHNEYIVTPLHSFCSCISLKEASREEVIRTKSPFVVVWSFLYSSVDSSSSLLHWLGLSPVAPSVPPTLSPVGPSVLFCLLQLYSFFLSDYEFIIIVLTM